MHRAEGISRRHALAAIPALLVAAVSGDAVQSAIGEKRGKIRNVIYLFTEGGLGGVDSWDPKEPPCVDDAAFDSIATSVPGVRFSGNFPRLAEVMDRITLIRNRVTTPDEDGFLPHAHAVRQTMRSNADDHTNLITRLARMTGFPHVHMDNENSRHSSTFDFRNAGFGLRHGVEAYWDASRPLYRAPNFSSCYANLPVKVALCNTLNSSRDTTIAGARVAQLRQQREEAYELVCKSQEVVSHIPERKIRAYTNGEKPSQATMGPLCAVELIRHNIARIVFVRTGFNGINTGNSPRRDGGWDHHFNIAEYMPLTAPPFDYAAAQLIRDVTEDDELRQNTVIVCGGEFGRQPRITEDLGGREHLGVQSSWIVSPVTKDGAVIGATNKYGLLEDESGMHSEQFARVIEESVQYEPDISNRVGLPAEIFA
jgi:hypothetical protein